MDGITVGRAERSGLSRMTILVKMDDQRAGQITAQLQKLIDVLDVKEIRDPLCLQELAVLKLSDQCWNEDAAALLPENITMMERGDGFVLLRMIDTPDAIDQWMRHFRSFGIKGVYRTGTTAVLRESSSSISRA